MRSPHELSRRFAVDPAYSAGSAQAVADGSSLFSAPLPDEAAWIYAWGDLEAWLLARMRLEAFRVCSDVFHPGLVRRAHQFVQFRKKLTLASVPEDCTVSVRHSGNVLFSNGRQQIARLEGEDRPVRHTVDLRPLLQAGEVVLTAIVTRLDGPPALLIESDWLRTDATWVCSVDHSRREDMDAVAVFARGGLVQFPHDERLPTMTLEAAGMKDGCHDFGCELLARPLLEISGEGGTALIFPGESIPEALNRDPTGFEQSPQTVVASGPGTYAAKNELAFRYLQIECDAKIDKVSAEAGLYPADYRGAFASSDETLTRIWMHSASTLRLCMRELYIDGPKRDRLPWVGDVFIGALGNAVTFADEGIVRRTLVALFPEDPLRMDCNGIIDYSLYWIITLERFLMFGGDFPFARAMWPRAKELLRALETRENRRGFLSSDKAAWVFIDWARIDTAGECAALQMLYILALEAAAAMGRELQDDDARAFATKAARLRRLARKSFWNAEKDRFVEGVSGGGQSGKAGRHANFLSLLAGVATPRQSRSILDGVLLGTETPEVGTPYMRYFENAALCKAGRAAAMLERLRAYWGGMLDLGATTLWEGYNLSASGAQHHAFYGRPFGKSLCHAWAAGPLHLLSADLVCLKPLAPGWQRFSVRMPRIKLPWLCASVPTPQGDIRWEIEKGRGKIEIPGGKQFDLRASQPMTLSL